MSGPYKSTQAKPNQQSLIKPAELIDVVELTPLQLIDRRTFNLMLGEAWEDIGEDVEHSISKNELTANHREKQRLSDSIERLMGALVKIKLQRDGQTYTQTFHLLEQVDEPERSDGKVYYRFPRPLRKVITDSSIFARLQKDVMHQLSSKYSLALYEMIQRRGNMSKQWTETFTLDDLRSLLGVADGRLSAYKNFKAKAIKPAVEEVNGLSDFGIKFFETKKGKTVTHVTIGWHKKSMAELKASFKELRSSRIGRRSRLKGNEEQIV